MSGVTVTEIEIVEGVETLEVEEGNFKRGGILHAAVKAPLETVLFVSLFGP